MFTFDFLQTTRWSPLQPNRFSCLHGVTASVVSAISSLENYTEKRETKLLTAPSYILRTFFRELTIIIWSRHVTSQEKKSKHGDFAFWIKDEMAPPTSSPHFTLSITGKRCILCETSLTPAIVSINSRLFRMIIAFANSLLRFASGIGWAFVCHSNFVSCTVAIVSSNLRRAVPEKATFFNWADDWWETKTFAFHQNCVKLNLIHLDAHFHFFACIALPDDLTDCERSGEHYVHMHQSKYRERRTNYQRLLFALERWTRSPSVRLQIEYRPNAMQSQCQDQWKCAHNNNTTVPDDSV